MKKLLIIVLIISAVGAGYLVYRSGQTAPSNSNSSKLNISTSFYPLYYFASQIAGSHADVYNITPSGAEPHDYEPTSQDIARIEDGQMLVLNGGVEAWGNKIKDTLKRTKTVVVTAGQGLLTQQVTEGGETGTDPHVWLDPIRAKQEVRAITQALIQVDAAHTSDYQAREQALDTKLDQLDAAYKIGLQTCQRKDIITSHAAFGYLASRYGLNQVPIAGLSPDAEPSGQQLADIAKFAKDHQVKYIFFESLVSPKLSQTIATEVGAKTLVLDPIEGVSKGDAKAGRDYVSIMMDNLKNLQTALQCST